MKIGLVYNLRKTYLKKIDDPIDADAEWDSEKTIYHLTHAIESLGHTVIDIGSPENVIHKFNEFTNVDLVFNIAEGRKGRCRESQVPAMCELFNIPYTFSDPLTMAIALDKILCKQIIQKAGIPTAPFWKISTAHDMTLIPENAFPLFVKPALEGTAKGITSDSMVRDRLAFEKQVTYLITTYKEPVLVEQFLSGKEFTIAVIGNPNPYILGMMEIIINDPSQNNIYTFDAKENWKSKVTYTFFNDRENVLWKQLSRIALEAYTVLECRDVARVDVRCDERQNPYFMEINPLPGLTPEHSDFPMIAGMVGRSYESLINEIIEQAWQRYH
ncbi:MAG: hypothetical protein A2Y62_19430 [Candidatus Fischerbacteria bacterium RBG_13_37_8]|uniref:ATP-grasp domain-containing protein n=1 Tax=Candidatus Fischerbacteria bacterium RBG_13_37_8 TaxID=1817863 RepID=A0A1F5VN27_9BACT|nr:MAG: hypothetical protein A2Y62_19430 [Candidatus Fischerbacteria bacterium RBG_13_37_8]